MIFGTFYIIYFSSNQALLQITLKSGEKKKTTYKDKKHHHHHCCCSLNCVLEVLAKRVYFPDLGCGIKGEHTELRQKGSSPSRGAAALGPAAWPRAVSEHRTQEPLFYAPCPQDSQRSRRRLWGEEIQQVPFCRRALDTTTRKCAGGRVPLFLTAILTRNLSKPGMTKVRPGHE